MQTDPPRVLQMRLVVEADDYDEAVRFFRDVLGLREEDAFSGAGRRRVAILDAGRATLEIANPAQKRMIDEVEVGRPVAPEDCASPSRSPTRASVTDALVAAGAELIAAAGRDAVALAELAARRAGRPPDHALPGARPEAAAAELPATATCSASRAGSVVGSSQA